MRRLRTAAIAVAVLAAAFSGVLALRRPVIGARVTVAPAPSAPATSYPYGSPEFRQLVADSYAPFGTTGGEFFEWMDTHFRDRKTRSLFPGASTLSDAIAGERLRLSQAPSVAERTRLERKVAADLHRLVKDLIPRFSLERGYEFRNVVERGERQCLLQSALIAALLQAIRAEAGVVMVYRNPRGEESNNGHAAALVKLPDGTDLIVDASDPEPFQQHRGIFATAGGYRFLRPQYAARSAAIVSYRGENGRQSLGVADVRPLDFDFLRSQFWYYRGERAEGGILAASPTKDGLRRSERYLRGSVKACPGNPLAVYMLGRTYLAEGRREEALSTLQQASLLYSRSGWLPSGPREALARAKRELGKRPDSPS